MKPIYYFLKSALALGLLLLLLPSCETEDEKSGIEGKWMREGDNLVVLIEGSSGTFHDFGTGRWTNVEDQGFVALGDLKFKDISSEGPAEWSYYDLWYNFTGSTINYVYWSNKGTITLSEDGNTLTTSSTTDSSSSTNTYFRVND